jgi:hypothetical protein
MALRHALSGLALAATLTLLGAFAHAQVAPSAPDPVAGPRTAASRRAAAAFEQKRPFAVAEAGIGLFTLPGADVCIASLDRCEQGETSLAVGIHNLYRYGRVGVGAGIIWATTLRSDSAKGVAELERDHSRRYFQMEAVFRYYAFETDTVDWWVGSTLGGVVVNDSWTVKDDREPYSDTAFVGPRAATVGTEGLASGLAFGGEWSFAENWSFGGLLRYSMWFLPDTPERSPTGDYASLKGRVDTFDLGLRLAYRIAL